MYNNLKFFDKEGKLLNFTYNRDLDKWTGNLYFNLVSEGLIENSVIHILETAYLNGSNTAYPQQFVTDLDSNNKIDVNLKNEKTLNEFFFYEFDQDKDTGEKFIIKKSNLEITLNQYEVELVDNNKYILTSHDENPPFLPVSPISINIAFKPSKEDIYENILVISNGDHIIAEINLYGEGEGEDERLRDMLINLGYDLIPEDVKIFSDSDVKEDLLDWNLINRKRKELLLEHSNLYPYIGSYKALVNVLKFFGYKNIKLKEYWLNVDTTSPNIDKLYPVDIEDLFLGTSDPYVSDITLGNKIYKKTGKISLNYDIIVESGEFDDEGLPLTKEVYEFSQEEVLLKLFALKKKLQEYFLPIGSHIIDIIGEAVFFGLCNVGFSTSYGRMDHVISGIENPQFEIANSGNLFYIEDLRFLGEIRNDKILTPEQIQKVLNNEKTNQPDDVNIQVGFPLVVKNNTFDIVFDNLKATFNEILKSGSHLNWENIEIFDNFELVWTVEYEQSANPDKYFKIEKYTTLTEDLNIDNYFGVVLPYVGSYTVSLSIRDLYNFSTRKIKNGFITVNSYEADFIGWYKKIESDQTFDNSTIKKRQIDRAQQDDLELTWDNYTAEWQNPQYPNEPVSIADLSYESLNSVNFYQSLDNSIENSGIGYFDYKFNSLNKEIQWSDLSYLDWNSAGSRTIQWRISDFVNSGETYHEISLVNKHSISTLTFNDTLINKSEYLALLNELLIIGGNFDKFLYYLVEKDDSFDIFAISREPDSVDSYLIKYRNSIYDEYTESKPYLVDYIGFLGDTPGHFEIYDVIPNEDIVIELFNVLDNTLEYPINYSSSGFSTLEEFYLDLIDPNNTESQTKFKDFYIEPTYKIIGLDEVLIKIQFIQKNTGIPQQYEIDIVGLKHSSYFKNVFTNISYDNIRILKYSDELPIMTNLHLCYDNSKIPGKNKPEWRISKVDDTIPVDIYYTNKYLSYTFTERGTYTISLQLEDSNKNIKTKIKEYFIKII